MNDCLNEMEIYQCIEWGGIPEEQRKDHSENCTACREKLLSLKHLESRLRDLATAMGVETTPNAAQTAAAWKRLGRNLPGSDRLLAEVAEGTLTLGRLLVLRRMVRSACGTNLATRAILEAAKGTATTDAESKWKIFLQRLSELLSMLCGETLGRMVVECGELI